MYYIYVDDSGTPHPSDHSQYYVISGVIMHESLITHIERAVRQYKVEYFHHPFAEAEIHTYNIAKTKAPFIGLDDLKRTHILNNFYSLFGSLPITVISVGIDKTGMRMKRPTWNSEVAAWTFITERYEMFLKTNGREKGVFRIDKSSNVTVKKITKVINDLRAKGSAYCRIDSIPEEPLFIDSYLREGLQLADVAAYCTFRKLSNDASFDNYWEAVHSKLHNDGNGKVQGFGMKLFP